MSNDILKILGAEMFRLILILFSMLSLTSFLFAGEENECRSYDFIDSKNIESKALVEKINKCPETTELFFHYLFEDSFEDITLDYKYVSKISVYDEDDFVNYTILPYVLGSLKNKSRMRRLLVLSELVDTIPQEIVAFQNLEYFKIKSKSDIYFPKYCWDLRRLDTLILLKHDRDSLSNMFPRGLENLHSLEYLEIEGLQGDADQFVKLLKSIIKIDSIKFLRFTSCNIKEIPKEIEQFKNLDMLVFARCEIDSIPSFVDSLENVKDLLIFWNYGKIEEYSKLNDGKERICSQKTKWKWRKPMPELISIYRFKPRPIYKPNPVPDQDLNIYHLPMDPADLNKQSNFLK